MAHFVLNSLIKISNPSYVNDLATNLTLGLSNPAPKNPFQLCAGFQFKGITDVVIKKSILSYTQTAILKIPASCIYKGTRVATAITFNEGWEISVKLGYNDSLQEEFKGFVRSINEDNPLTVECEGYSYILKRKKFIGKWKQISVKSLLTQALQDTGIKLDCNIEHILYRFNNSIGTVASAIDEILRITNGTITIFFIEPTVLWVGLVYTPYLQGKKNFLNFSGSSLTPTVSYKIGFNIPHQNSLKKKSLENNPQLVVYTSVLPNGKKIKAISTNKNLGQKEVKRHAHNIHDAKTLQIMADEELNKKNYIGYTGSITSFLVPFALPGYSADLQVKDNYNFKGEAIFSRGTYIIISTETKFGQSGARRYLELGPKIT